MKKIFFFSILIITVESEDNGTSCDPIHAQGHGINLICCNKENQVTPDCEFSNLCKFHRCKCNLFVSSSFDCNPENNTYSTLPYSWKDHAPGPKIPFFCLFPNFPNEKKADYSIHLNNFNLNSVLFFSGLRNYKIISVSIEADFSENFSKILNFAEIFPDLIFFSIKSPSKKNIGNLKFLNGLKKLEHLNLINLNFEFGSEPKWLRKIRKIHVQNSDFSDFPKWMAFAENLERLTIQKTNLKNVVVISQLKNLIILKLDENFIEDLHGISFSSNKTLEISLKNNKIKSIGAHTFLQSTSLRILDLSGNRISFLPPKAFQFNEKLKVLKLDSNKIEELKTHQFVGLETLRTLGLSRNPIKAVDPFAFLPLSKSLRNLELNGCDLTRIPLAVTQCCSLERLELNENRFFDGDSMPSEVLALISGLKSISFERNPLMKLPEGLFLIPETNTQALEGVIDTLIQLPVWRNEPCTPFMWNFHLANSTSHLRRKLSVWNEARMRHQNLGHCEFLYERLLENLQLYRELAENSGCEANRRLRRVRESCGKNKKNHSSKKQKSTVIKDVHPHSPSGVFIVEKSIESNSLQDQEIVLFGSLLANAMFVVIFVSGFVYIMASRIVSRPRSRNGFESIEN